MVRSTCNFTKKKGRKYKDTELGQLKAYYYKVRSIRRTDQKKSEFSRKVRAVVLPKKPEPVIIDKTASSVTLSWKTNKCAQKYVIYRSKSKDGKYQKIGSTKKNTFRDRGLKSESTFYYRVCAVGPSRDGLTSHVTSGYKTVKAVTKKKVSKTVYIGDSLMQGIREYHIINNGNGKRVITKIGISPSGFVRSSYMSQVLSYNPDRVYIMIGLNAIEGHPSDKYLDQTLGYTRQIIQKISSKNSQAQIVLLPVAPVRPGASASQSVSAVMTTMMSSVSFDTSRLWIAKSRQMPMTNSTADCATDAPSVMKSGTMPRRCITLR